MQSLGAKFHHEGSFEPKISFRHQHIILHRTLEDSLRVRHATIFIRQLFFNGTFVWVSHDYRWYVRFLMSIRVSGATMVCYYSILHLWGELQVWSGRLWSINMCESAAHILFEEGFCWQHFVLFYHITLNWRCLGRRFNNFNFVDFVVSFAKELLNSLLWILIQLRNS